MSFFGCSNVWCKSVILCFLLSPSLLADIIDFENFDFTSAQEGAISVLHNESMLFGQYQITVWEGFILDDSFYASQFNALYPDKTLHPTKSASIGESNKSLVTQRFSLKRLDDKPFYLCHLNVAEKAFRNNQQPLLIKATYYVAQMVNGQLIQNEELYLNSTKNLDGIDGYEQYEVDFGRAVSILDFTVINDDGAPGQLMFDDLILELLSSNCSQ